MLTQTILKHWINFTWQHSNLIIKKFLCDFDIEDKERSGPSKKFEDEELEALLDQDPCQTQEEVGKTLEVTQQAICKCLKAAGYIHKQGNWVPHEAETH